MHERIDWAEAVSALAHEDTRDLQRQIMDLLHRKVQNGDRPPPAVAARLDELYLSVRDPALSAELKRLQNRLRGKIILGKDLLRLPSPPPDDPDGQRLWEALSHVRSAFDEAAGRKGRFEAAYEVFEEIGSGGMSVVFRAIRLKDRKTVAVKYLKKEFLDNPEILARFRRECRLGLGFEHPNIIDIFDTNQNDHGTYLIMEYLPLGGVDTLLNHPDLTPGVGISAVRQAAEAAAYIHAQEVIHRDIKLSNLLVSKWDPKDYDGDNIHVKLADFGLCKRLPGDGLTRSGKRLGTDLYVAPEQWESSADVDHRADIYSLGVCLYRLVSRKGFPAGDYPMLSEIQPELPPALDELLKQCLKVDPEKRLSSAEVLADKLGEIEWRNRRTSNQEKMNVEPGRDERRTRKR